MPILSAELRNRLEWGATEVLYEAQDRIDAQRDELIQGMEKQLEMEHRVESVFTVRWSVC